MTNVDQLFSSIQFHVVMTVVSVVVLADSLYQTMDTQNLVLGGARVVIWIVIAFHFTRLTLNSLKQTKSS